MYPYNPVLDSSASELWTDVSDPLLCVKGKIALAFATKNPIHKKNTPCAFRYITVFLNMYIKGKIAFAIKKTLFIKEYSMCIPLHKSIP